MTEAITTQPVDTESLFGIATNFNVNQLNNNDEHIPEIDHDYYFDPDTTQAILAGFSLNRRVMLQGYHGTGKSTHIEQIAARLNWPCIRVNLDGNVTRIDLVGRDAIILKDGKQITEFKEGIIPWAVQRPVALVLDEYDAARPDVVFILQRLLEQNGKFTLVDQNKVLTPHPYFRLFATANTIGLGDATGLYHGTQPINQGQMDRWSIVCTLNYLDKEDEKKIILSKCKDFYQTAEQQEVIDVMISLANMTRSAFEDGDISNVMSPRTVINWATNYHIFGSLSQSFRLSFLNKCDENERSIIAEFYQRCFGEELPESEMKNLIIAS